MQLKDGCAALGPGSSDIFPNGSPQITRMVGLHGPVCARQLHQGWLIRWLPVPLFCCQWKPCSHHLAGVFSPIVGIYLGATWTQEAAWWRTELRIGGMTLRQWFRYVPSSPSLREHPYSLLLRSDWSSLVPLGSWHSPPHWVPPIAEGEGGRVSESDVQGMVHADTLLHHIAYRLFCL